MTYFPDALRLEVSDDGKGVDLYPLNKKLLQTLVSASTQHAQAGPALSSAEFSMNSTLQAGTAITIFLPVELTTDDPKQ